MPGDIVIVSIPSPFSTYRKGKFIIKLREKNINFHNFLIFRKTRNTTHTVRCPHNKKISKINTNFNGSRQTKNENQIQRKKIKKKIKNSEITDLFISLAKNNNKINLQTTIQEIKCMNYEKKNRNAE